jgi:uncharacterized protein YfaT (DUF1175 family)
LTDRRAAERLYAASVALAVTFAIFVLIARRPAAPIRVSVSPSDLPNDGAETAALTIAGPSSPTPRISALGARVENLEWTGGRWVAQLRPGVIPGPIAVRVEFSGRRTATARLTSHLSDHDSLSDGTPDFLRLDDESDRRAFRQWFTWLAEAQYFQDPARRPAEISDCAALIRYAYREALHAHDAAWAEMARVPLLPAFDSVSKYQYPNTPLGAALFRVKDGPFQSSFAQFADAQTLRKHNTHFVTRDLARAQAGDLLFFRQEAGEMPFHSMIFLGDSPIRGDRGPYLLYHTGPDGEIKRPTVAELLSFPQPEWRPVPANPNFLGVYRWNILR